MPEDMSEESPVEELADWSDRLERAVVGTRFDAGRVRVMATCDSTQDHARNLGAGAVVTTGRQVAGRGRLGRSWIDDRGAGLAVSLALPALASDLACIAIAVATLDAVRCSLEACGTGGSEAGGRLGLKFPNDLVDRRTGRKVAGILVEVVDGIAVVGIGINVGIRDWPSGLNAIALEEILEGSRVRIPPRIEILEHLLPAVDRAWAASPTDLDRRFAVDHAPTGERVEIEEDVLGGSSRRIRGTLRGFDPRRTLEVENDDGLVVITAARARILSWGRAISGPDRSGT
ncbi:MAG: hypothetical protein CMJ51_06495 [Planctomycetaceae bacterium]|nr:hypothetical protein [Planctomycetaceae bacterium]